MHTTRTVLVVDDTDDSRQLAAVVLESAGFRVLEAATGTEALSLVRSAGPDAVVLDVHLPDVDGFEVCRRLKTDPGTADVPVLFLSATYTGLDARVRGLESGGEGYLAKPYEPAELTSAVTNLVRLREAEVAIAERTRAEEALRAREAQLRHLGDNLPNGVIYQVVRRPDGSNYFPYMSAGLERMYGATAEEALRDARVVYRLVVPEDLVRVRAAADESIRTGEPIDVEYRLRTPQGEERWFNLRARPSRLADGATQWDAVALDVTDRKRAEEALRQREAQLRGLADDLRCSEARYRLLFERSFVGIFRTRQDGVVMDCNDAFARILGYEDAAQMRGRSVIEHYATPADRDDIVARLSAGEEVVDAEVTARRRNGSLVPVAMSVRRVVEQEGRIHEGILIDLTDRKRAEEATALRSAAELANAAAHEINNPLAVVVGQLDLIEKGRNVAHGIATIREAALRIRDIVRHMTRITRLERSTTWSPNLPHMLDLRRSGDDDEPGRPPVDAPRT